MQSVKVKEFQPVPVLLVVVQLVTIYTIYYILSFQKKKADTVSPVKVLYTLPIQQNSKAQSLKDIETHKKIAS